MKNILILLAILVAAGFSLPLYAQNGCVNSPENPTALLALLGASGAFLASACDRLRRR